jgi:RNA-dependent RNA polymerase
MKYSSVGMLCLDINNSIPPGDIGVYFRDSMRKFGAQDFSIDVVRTSAHPTLAYLNRQIILLLSSLGISDHIFLSLQDRMLQRLSLLTEDPHQACETLRELNEFGGNGCHAFLIDYLRRLGKQKEPFARRILDAFKAFLVKELKTKAKILVPNS